MGFLSVKILFPFYHHRNMAIGQIHDEDTCCLPFLSYNQLLLSSSGNSIRWKRTRKSGGKHKLASGKTGQWQSGTVAHWQSGTEVKLVSGQTIAQLGKWPLRHPGTLPLVHCYSSSSTLLLFLGLSFNWRQTINWHLELEQVLVHRNVVDVILLDLKLCCFSETTCFLVVLVFGLSKVA